MHEALVPLWVEVLWFCMLDLLIAQDDYYLEEERMGEPSKLPFLYMKFVLHSVIDCYAGRGMYCYYRYY